MPQPTSVPEMLPVLSRGKHRSPRKGACFMELASFLAGEKWSDHPSCTHPLLAEVARNVNDRTSDADRPLLAPLIPSVIGLTTDDVRADARIALHCALTALPVAAYGRQRALAVAVLTCVRQLTELDDPEAAERRAQAWRAIDGVPDAGRWAVAFAARTGLDQQDASARHFRRRSAPSIVSLSARSIAEAAVPSHDALLRVMLEGAIDELRALRGTTVPCAVADERWRAAWALTQ